MIIWKESNQLQEKLVPATNEELDKLEQQAQTDSRLSKQLTTAIGKLPQYKYLFTAYERGIVNSNSLIALLRALVNHFPDTKILFSKGGDNFSGFLAYNDEGTKITGLKVASFFDNEKKSAIVVLRDIRKFITEAMKNHKSVEWSAFVENLLNMIYQKTVPEWFPNYGFWYEMDTHKANWLYKLYRK